MLLVASTFNNPLSTTGQEIETFNDLPEIPKSLPFISETNDSLSNGSILKNDETKPIQPKPIQPKSKSNIPPLIGDKLEWDGVKVDFSFLLLNACLITGRENLKELYSNKTNLKWNRAFAIEWLEERIEGATEWSRSTLNDRFVKAEKMTRRFGLSKSMANKTGMGDISSLTDNNLIPSNIKKIKKTPSNQDFDEHNISDMVKELDQIRTDLNDYKTAPKRRFDNKKTSSAIEAKALQFSKSILPQEKFNFRRVQILNY